MGWYIAGIHAVCLLASIAILYECVSTSGEEASTGRLILFSGWSLLTTLLWFVVVSLSLGEAPQSGQDLRNGYHRHTSDHHRKLATSIPLSVYYAIQIVLSCFFAMSSLLLVGNCSGLTAALALWNPQSHVFVEAQVKTATFMFQLVVAIWGEMHRHRNPDEIASLLEQGRAPTTVVGQRYQSMMGRGRLHVPLAV